MKIYLQNHFDWCKIMKFTFSQIVIALIVTGMSYATTSRGQAVLEQRFDVNVHNSTLGTALKQLEKETNLKFVYRKSLVDGDATVSVDARQETLGKILSALLQPRGIAFEVVSNRIVLSKAVAQVPPTVPVAQPVTEQQAETVENAAKVVTGTVTDDTGQPLPGVSVVIRGTALGTQTDLKGRYSLNVPDVNATLIFSFIGYVQQDILVSGSNVINVQLKGAPSSLNEVVVIGYGQQRKADVTSAVTSVQAKDFVTGPVTDAGELLKGIRNHAERYEYRRWYQHQPAGNC